MPKMEKCDSSALPCPPAAQYSQPQQSVTPTGTPVGNSPVKPGTPTLSRQGSLHDVSASSDHFARMPVNPRPGVPPQLLPQNMASAVHTHPQQGTAVSPHPSGVRAPTGIVVSQPLTPQPVMMRDPFQDGKVLQRRLSAADAYTSTMQMSAPSPSIPHSPGNVPDVAGS